jgi:carboxymethylenebutenolidase
VVVVHEASGLNDNIRDICGRFAAEGYAALGVDLFEGRNRAVCMARMFAGGMAGNLDYYGVPALKARSGSWPAARRSMPRGSAPSVSAWAVPSG